MKWPLLDVQQGGLQSRQALKDARSPSPAHIVVSNTLLGTFPLLQALLPLFVTEEKQNTPCSTSLIHSENFPGSSPLPFPHEWIFKFLRVLIGKMRICLHSPLNHSH